MFRRLFGRGQDAPRTEEEAQQEEQKIDNATEKTRKGLFGQISNLFAVDDPITDELWDDLEMLLIQADVGLETTQYLVNRTPNRAGASAHALPAGGCRASVPSCARLGGSHKASR
jgi:fused signal recognition particle receptor